METKKLKEHVQIEKLVEDLYGKDSKAAYASFKVLEQKSKEGNLVYSFFDTFSEMMDHENSYIRTRGLLLIAANAKWDSDYKIDEVIDDYLKHILDDKPITARQCIEVLPQIALYKEELKEIIADALRSAKPEQHYPESMWPLVKKDIEKALKDIKTI